MISHHYYYQETKGKATTDSPFDETTLNPHLKRNLNLDSPNQYRYFSSEDLKVCFALKDTTVSETCKMLNILHPFNNDLLQN